MGVWLRKSSHRFHGFAQMAWLRLFSHGIHRIHRSFVASVLPRNSRNSQKFCCVNSPTEFTEFTEVWLRLFSHGIHRIHRSFIASVLPQNSRNSQKFCCVGSPTEFTEFTEVLLRRFSHGIHRIHRSFIASHSSINLESVLWKGLLCQKVLCVPWVLWEYSLPRISQINTDGWLRLFSHGFHGIHRSFGVLLAAWVWQDAIPS